MPGGFGYGGFGEGPFGSYDWAEEVLWDDVPEQPDRAYDADPAGGDGALRGFQQSCMGVYRIILDKLRDADQLRDPENISTRFQNNVDVEITASAVEVEGRSVRVTVNGPGAAVDPFDPLGGVSCGWTLIDRLGREFLVDAVHKLTLSFIVVGNSLPTVAAVPGVADAVLRAPALIEFLGNDYGVDTDDNDPEAYQRASVRDAWQWYRRKGSNDSYQIVGDIYGHDVTAERLWYVGASPPGTDTEIVIKDSDLKGDANHPAVSFTAANTKFYASNTAFLNGSGDGNDAIQSTAAMNAYLAQCRSHTNSGGATFDNNTGGGQITDQIASGHVFDADIANWPVASVL